MTLILLALDGGSRRGSAFLLATSTIASDVELNEENEVRGDDDGAHPVLPPDVIGDAIAGPEVVPVGGDELSQEDNHELNDLDLSDVALEPDVLKKRR